MPKMLSLRCASDPENLNFPKKVTEKFRMYLEFILWPLSLPRLEFKNCYYYQFVILRTANKDKENRTSPHWTFLGMN